MAAAEHKSDFKLTTNIPYLALTGELWGVYCKNLGENWPRYNSTALYYLEYEYLHKKSFVYKKLTIWSGPNILNECVPWHTQIEKFMGPT